MVVSTLSLKRQAIHVPGLKAKRRKYDVKEKEKVRAAPVAAPALVVEILMALLPPLSS